MMKKKFLFIGRGKKSFAVLQAFLAKKISFEEVWISDKFNEGCDDKFRELTIKKKIKIKFISEIGKKEIKELKKLNIDYVFCLFWKFKIKKQYLSTVPFINLHFGFLPSYRGNACINWAIIRNETLTGVTIHFMDEFLDSGPIIMKKKIKIKLKDNITYLDEKFLNEGIKLLIKFVHNLRTKKKWFTKNKKNLLGFAATQGFPKTE